MRSPAILTAIAIALPSSAADMSMPAARACALTEQQAAAMLAADYRTFDQTPSGTQTWRPLISEGCYEAAAQVIERYLITNHSSLAGEEIRTLNFHVGQALAMGGRDAEAIPWFEKSRDADANAEWLSYVDATVAFLKRDHDGLVRARARYLAATSRHAPRLRVIDGYLACEAKSYLEAMMCAAPR